MTVRKVLLLLFILSACTQIKRGDKLSKADLERLQKLNLLDEDEIILKFYSEFKNNVAGNFITNKRIAKYWIDEKDNSRNQISYAYYRDIDSIDTVYYAGATYCAYMLITKIDKSNFKVCVDGKREEIKSFFEQAIDKWTQAKNVR